MIHNKYLEDLGIKRENHSINFCNDKDDPRQKSWKKERKKYGFDSREVWNLDKTFIEWLYSHLRMYKDTTIIDLDKDILYNVVVSKDKIIESISMRDALEFMLTQCENYLLNKESDYLSEEDPKIYEALHMFVDTFTAWWW